jgi:hypothetical protein
MAALKQPARRGACLARPARQAVRWALLSGLVVLLVPAAQAVAQAATEYQVKAAFLYNFAKFVEWPAAVLADSAAPLVVGVRGEDPFGADLDAALRGKTAAGHPLQVRRFDAIPASGACHILFVCSRVDPPEKEVLGALAAAPVLTVGETPQFTHLGGILRFVVQDNKVRFEINVDAADRAGLRISSKLLRLALIVRDGGP